MPETTYRKICEKECEWCAAGWEICCRSEMTGEFHRPPEGGLHRSCTAPTRDQVIDRLTSALERAEKVARRGKHGADCPHYLPSGWRWETRKRDREPCNCMKRDILAALESKEQVKANAEV